MKLPDRLPPKIVDKRPDGSVVVKAKMKRNDKCPCDSGKKFKHCHGVADQIVTMAFCEKCNFQTEFAKSLKRSVCPECSEPVLMVGMSYEEFSKNRSKIKALGIRKYIESQKETGRVRP